MIRKPMFSHLRKACAYLTGSLMLMGVVMAQSAAQDTTAISPANVKWVDCGEGWPAGCQAAWVAGDATKETSYWFCRAPKGALFPRHSHTGAERIVALQGRITGGTDNGDTVKITQGGYLSFSGKSVHWARCEDDCLMFIVHDGAYDQTFH